MRRHEPLHFAERKMRDIEERFPFIDEYMDYARRQVALGFPDAPELKEAFCQEELASYAEDVIVCLKTLEHGRRRAELSELDKNARVETILRGEYCVLPYMVAARRRWRDSKHIYRFDTTLIEELFDQPLADNLPKELFDRLPYDVIFIDCSSAPKPDGVKSGTAGFWVFRSSVPSDDGKSAEDSLCMVFLDHRGHLQCESLCLERPTISQIVDGITNSRKDALNRIDLPEGFIEEALLDKQGTKAWMTRVLNLILYVCSVNADIQQSHEPSPAPKRENPKKRNRKSSAFIYDVGFRIGPALGAARAQKTLSASGEGPAKAPHVRRAHWHHYWKGPRDGERKLILKWLAPIAVNADLGAPSLTIHEASQ